MRAARDAEYNIGSIVGIALGLLAAFGHVPACGQSLDLGGTAGVSTPPEPSLDLDAAVAPAKTAPVDKVTAGLTPLTRLLHPDQSPGQTVPSPSPDAASGGPQQSGVPTEAPAQPPSEPVVLDHPVVVDTAKLTAGNTSVALFGILGQSGDAAKGLQGYIDGAGAKATCQQQTNAGYICLLADGTDVAEVSLRNGAAQTSGDASEAYRDQEAAAQNERRGIWSNLPPPPVQLKHPAVRDTATLVLDGKSYQLDGVDGLGGQYARDLQGYIAAHDDSLMCQPQGKPDHYICVLSDGTDIAKVALVNGAARVATDCPDAYRIQQGEALDNKRGMWANVTLAATYSQSVHIAHPSVVVVPGDEGEGVSYVGGAPAAIVEGETVFLTYGGDLGWGYYDYGHHWHGAPSRFATHMEHYHPGGVGLRGYPGGFSAAHVAVGGGTHFSGGFVHPTAVSGGFHPSSAASFHPSSVGSVGHHR